MKRIIANLAVGLLMACAPMGVMAAASGVQLDEPGNTLSNTASLQRGAKYFVNYCLGCHSLKYVRYSSLVEDLGITEEQLMNNLMFTAEKPTGMMNAVMGPADSERWFGVTPPEPTIRSSARFNSIVERDTSEVPYSNTGNSARREIASAIGPVPLAWFIKYITARSLHMR